MKKNLFIIFLVLASILIFQSCSKKHPLSPGSGGMTGSGQMKKAIEYDGNGIEQEYINLTYNGAGYMTDSAIYSVTISASPVLTEEDTYTYNAAGQTLTADSYEYGGVLCYYDNYTYDAYGNQTSETECYVTDSETYTYTYDYNSYNLVSRTVQTDSGGYSDTMYYMYNASKLTVTADEYDSTDTFVTRYKYIYDASNRLGTKDQYEENIIPETLSIEETFAYSGSNVINDSDYDMSSGTAVLLNSDVYTYNAAGLMTSDTYNDYYSGVLQNTYTQSWEYNSKNLLTKEINTDGSYGTFDYDLLNRWTKITDYDASNNIVDYFVIQY